MAEKMVQIFGAPAKAVEAAPRRAVFPAVTASLVAALLWLAALNRRYRLKIHFEDLPPDIRRDLGFREPGDRALRFPDWS